MADCRCERACARVVFVGEGFLEGDMASSVGEEVVAFLVRRDSFVYKVIEP